MQAWKSNNNDNLNTWKISRARTQDMRNSLFLQKEEAASQQQELDRVQRAYEHLETQERQLEESLSHISEEVKGATPNSA